MFLIGTAIYLLYAWIVYNPTLRESGAYIPLGLTVALAGNLIWLFIAKATPTNSLAFYALMWDTMVTLTFIVIPVAFFGMRLGLLSIAGFMLTIAGLAMMKYGSH